MRERLRARGCVDRRLLDELVFERADLGKQLAIDAMAAVDT